jgi:hypothetical protein
VNRSGAVRALSAVRSASGDTIPTVGRFSLTRSGRSAIQYIVLRAEGDPTKHILALGILQNYAQALFPFDGYQVTADAQGKIPFTIVGECNQGFSQQGIGGIVTIFFQ